MTNIKKSSTNLHAVTGFTILIAAIPAMIGWGQSELGPGSTEDADFWWLLTGMAFQLQTLSLFAARLLLSSSTKPTVGRPWLHAYVWVGILSIISAFPLYLWVSVRYSSAAVFLGSVDAALLHVQVTLATSFATTPEMKPKED
ncbi:hypothetical protein PG985_014832 [Apiospora marii]|uniref:uncharacterized protein n=1 Tax=Apiospora marii TaxID=335849 RepID=UPI0031310769